MAKYIGYIIIGILFYLLIKQITNALNIFYPSVSVILTLLVMVTIMFYHYNKLISLISYLLFILVFLFFREETQVNINFDFYLFDWLKIIFVNKIVFINIIGNLLLFMPLVFYIRNVRELLYLISLIVILELIQFLTKRGVFDIVDLVLNVFGVFSLTIIRRIYAWKR